MYHLNLDNYTQIIQDDVFKETYTEVFRDKEHDTHDLSSNFSEKKYVLHVWVCVYVWIYRENKQ